MFIAMSKQEASAISVLSRYPEWQQFAGYLHRAEEELVGRLVASASETLQIGKLQGGVAAVRAVLASPDTATRVVKTT